MTLHIVDVRLTCLINITYLLTYLLIWFVLVYYNANVDVGITSA